jgi:hypothetical protein
MNDEDYHVNKEKLNKYYALAAKSQDNRNFFTHLFNYMKTILNNSFLDGSANSLALSSYSHDHEEDREFLAIADVKDEDSITIKSVQQERLELYKKLLSDHRGERQTYYCWVKLFMFYILCNLEPDRLTRTDISSSDIYKILGDEIPAGTIDNFLAEVISIFDNDSENKVFSREKYSLYLDVFHTEFINWLPENLDNPVESQIAEQITEVELNFDDIYPIVTNTVTQDIYKFGRMVQTGTPYKIINYCRSKPGIFVTATTLPQDIHINKKGLIDSLRGCDFYPDKGALSVFLTVKKRPAKIMLHTKVRLNDLELQALIKEADEIITNS